MKYLDLDLKGYGVYNNLNVDLAVLILAALAASTTFSIHSFSDTLRPPMKSVHYYSTLDTTHLTLLV